jgi:AcrR family transcriptional regulator
MYHFSTKEELLAAILERMAARYERELLEQIASRRSGSDADAVSDADADSVAGEDLASAPAEQRHLAYLDWACQAQLSAADLVIFADPHLRVPLTEQWQEQVETWLSVPAEVGADRRARLLAVRLMADGLWFDRAAGLLGEVDAQAERLCALAAEMLDQPAGGDAR